MTQRKERVWQVSQGDLSILGKMGGEVRKISQKLTYQTTSLAFRQQALKLGLPAQRLVRWQVIQALALTLLISVVTHLHSICVHAHGKQNVILKLLMGLLVKEANLTIIIG